jgi:hypothetical protein
MPTRKMCAKNPLFSCLLVKPESADKRPKLPLFNGPKFLASGSSARLQGAQKKLRVVQTEIG